MALARSGGSVLREAAGAFQEDRCRRLGAGLAYYALFALVPTLLLTAMIAATLVGREAVEGELADQLDEFVGPESAAAVQDAVAGLWQNTDTSSFALVSILVVAYSSSILFVAWRDTLEIVWDVPYEADLFISLRSRAFGALVPITAGLLLAAVLILEVVVGFVGELVDSVLLDTTLQRRGPCFPGRRRSWPSVCSIATRHAPADPIGETCGPRPSYRPSCSRSPPGDSGCT